MAEQYPGTGRNFNVGASSGGGWRFSNQDDFLLDKGLKAGNVGTAEEGDFYESSTTGLIHYYADGAWQAAKKMDALDTSRVSLEWTAGSRGKPGINADIQNAAEAVRMIADPDFQISGTNASSDDVVFDAEGGIRLQTDGADGDEVIVLPHQDANQSSWAQWTWGTDKQARWGCVIQTGANIGDCIIWAGLKLTSTEVVATDADQAFFRYENAVNGGRWQAVSSIGGVDDAADSRTTAVAVGTRYRLEVAIDSSRLCRFYIDGSLVKTSAALTNAVNFVPYIGVAADGAAAAKTLIVYGQAISRSSGGP